eukprot:TRINITY_DN5285_c0_g1_i1.p1 TRINITY_DN5285_c0_g1~~TRINITY_DN5285_c0_g1_i1.p1  ORF type:complete len:811 (+),score=178.78 TRINITY_DN5285_c0_g1_i1:271-2433(+)
MSSPRTRIKYMTDGCLLRDLIADPQLRSYSVIVLDEAHERSVHTDILFGLIKELIIRPKRTTPKLVVMSATLESNKFAEFFDCDVFRVPGRTFPVELVYCDNDLAVSALPSSSGRATQNQQQQQQRQSRDGENDEPSTNATHFTHRAVEVVMDLHTSRPLGDVLVFLTGQGDIDRVCTQLRSREARLSYRADVKDENVTGMRVMPCYGALPTEEQQAIFRPLKTGERKVVVATNIAGTSLTIDGIHYVVDCGFVKQNVYNPKTQLDALVVVPVSKSEARQRSGRAGRTAPGVCIRLYNEESYEQLPEATIPEIQRTNLSHVLLSMKALGIRDVVNFDYMDSPEHEHIVDALRELHSLGALSDADGTLTEFGSLMSDFPLSPPLACVLLHSLTHKCTEEILCVLAMLSVEDIWYRPTDAKQIRRAAEMRKSFAEAGHFNDFSTLMNIYESFVESGCSRDWCKDYFIHFRAMQTAVQIRRQLENLLKTETIPKIKSMIKKSKEEHHSGKRKHPDDGRLGEFSVRNFDDDVGIFSCRYQAERRGDPVSSRTASIIARCMCTGLFKKTARRDHTRRGLFRTLDGNGNTCAIHPGSAVLADGEGTGFQWAIFNELQQTTKTFMYCVAPIEFEWVEHLLARIVVDDEVLNRSGVPLPAHHAATVAAAAARAEKQREREEAAAAVRAEQAKKAAEAQAGAASNVEAAKARFLQRQQQQQQQAGKKKG